ncbi:LysR substrate-binding domain-containing protein [Yanghanlia caeni]|uniref:LysR family transcriptional regulator n=1 Tax=Yanghanlia caeni TaxID=3064283 RepID=A0ABU1D8P6_9BURK|nr:LysR family transcriptional regulator [Alcaligenaceae bacterium LG-2]NGR07885.1 LysR family transcriptional regulator [bacterium SGD-2]HZH55622.1 LysR family transcriptional regulator [Burkholderiaceae bacterium]
MDWDNLRYFLELSRAGTLTAAARRLGVDHTTVARRIQALERGIGAQLFLREASGHRLTEAGRRLLPQVEDMEQSFRKLEFSAPASTEEELSGVVRVGVTEAFSTVILAPALATFARQHPRLVIDLLALPRQVNLSRREADIVISLERPARGPVLTTRLCDYSLHLYAAKHYLAQHPPVRSLNDLRELSFIGYVEDLLFSKELQYLDEDHRPERIALRSTSLLAQYQATRAAAGVAVLPAFLAERDALLQRVLPDQVRFVRRFWMSMPTENRPLPRMKAVWDLIRSTVDASRNLLMPD